jgi:hypothetical protein
MLPVIVAPDVELWACGWLRSALGDRDEPYASDVFVSNAVPNPRRDRMVTFRRDGGPRINIVEQQPRLGVNVWATTAQDATDLARLVEGLLLSVRDVPPVVAVSSLSGPSPVEDAQPRRYFTVHLITKGTES